MSNDHDYRSWLTSQVAYPEDRTYETLFMKMYMQEFTWMVPNDDNRVQDALDVRAEYMGHHGGPPVCCVLEVIVALSRRIAFIAEGDPAGWAWRLIENLELHKMYDPVGRRKKVRIDDILETFVWRNYEPDGQGGLFPLAWPKENQQKVEIWYQMSAWIDELLDY